MEDDSVVVWHTNEGCATYREMALAIVGGVPVPRDAVVPAMNTQPLSLVPNFHPIAPGPVGHTDWWMFGPGHHLQVCSFNRTGNLVHPSTLRPVAEELTTELSQYWPIARHPALALTWAFFDQYANPETTGARIQRWSDSCFISTPLMLTPEPIEEQLFPGHVVRVPPPGT